MSKPAETILSSIFKPIMNRLISLSDSSAKVNEKVTVPALTGKSVEKAKEDANNAGVSVEVIGTGKNVSRQSVGAGVKKIPIQRFSYILEEKLHVQIWLAGAKMKLIAS